MIARHLQIICTTGLLIMMGASAFAQKPPDANNIFTLPDPPHPNTLTILPGSNGRIAIEENRGITIAAKPLIPGLIINSLDPWNRPTTFRVDVSTSADTPSPASLRPLGSKYYPINMTFQGTAYPVPYQPETVIIWTMMTLPNGEVLPIPRRRTITLRPHTQVPAP